MQLKMPKYAVKDGKINFFMHYKIKMEDKMTIYLKECYEINKIIKYALDTKCQISTFIA